jgi:phage FluMu gp28-like protein
MSRHVQCICLVVCLQHMICSHEKRYATVLLTTPAWGILKKSYTIDPHNCCRAGIASVLEELCFVEAAVRLCGLANQPSDLCRRTAACLSRVSAHLQTLCTLSPRLTVRAHSVKSKHVFGSTRATKTDISTTLASSCECSTWRRQAVRVPIRSQFVRSPSAIARPLGAVSPQHSETHMSRT